LGKICTGPIFLAIFIKTNGGFDESNPYIKAKTYTKSSPYMFKIRGFDESNPYN